MTTPDRDYGRFVYAAGAVMLGVVGLAFADFALQWQPVPKGVPARTVLASSGGWFADRLGWGPFFVLATVACVPGLALLAWLMARPRATAAPTLSHP